MLRRELIKTGSLCAVSLNGINIGKGPSFIPSYDQKPDLLSESDVIPFAKRAVEAAMAAGAEYADARIIRKVGQGFLFFEEHIGAPVISDSESIGFGIRVLVDGCFGFAASPYIDSEEASILAKTAIEQAKANAVIRPRQMNWIKAPPQKGRWMSPAEDPFVVPIEERVDYINAWREDVKGYRDRVNSTKLVESRASFGRSEKFLVTSDGTEISQVIYNTGGMLSFMASPLLGEPMSGPHFVNVKGVNNQQGGWEVFKKANPKEQIPFLVAEAIENSKIGTHTFDVGRYDLVLDGSFVAGLVGKTFGISTQLDLARGYEANAGGTSYLGPNILDFLGTQVAHSSVTIRGNRSVPGMLATAKWDDEGVTTRDFDIVKDGMLVTYQTVRENSWELKEWSDKSKTTLDLQGCSYAQDGLNIPIQAAPNVEMSPNQTAVSFNDMVSQVKRGFAVYGGAIETSFNIKEGMGSTGIAREIRNGKLLNFTPGMHLMFNTPEIWKNITAVGDSTTLQRSGTSYSKGEPQQNYDFDAVAPALSVKDVPIIDPMRKA